MRHGISARCPRRRKSAPDAGDVEAWRGSGKLPLLFETGDEMG
jgi:hypothetical protein